ncbi:hypothetical protein GCM10009809_12690 [Isoptericola hypogeus]|uniref:Uncharacterized protein n=1 Tax=Isoptericola hypogeus TaxID=300179 RepID=A0ABP4V5N0_9MICO
MTTNHSGDHARDDRGDAPTDEALRRELDALAGLGAATSGLGGDGLGGALGGALGDGLGGALATVRRRVRRRRAAKQAGIGATTLVVAAGLVVGGASLLPTEPVPMPAPANTPTPSPSGSPTGSPTAGPTDGPSTQGAALGLIEDGYRPSWLEGVGVTCGMPADELPASSGGNLLELLEDPALGDDTSADGTQTVHTWRAGTRLTVPDPADAGRRVSLPTLLWVQDGRVVDLGVNTTEAGMDQVGDAPAERAAEDSSLTSCAPEHETRDGVTTDTYATELPAGAYEVRASVQLWSPDFTDVELVLSDPVTVVVAGGPGSTEGTNAGAADGGD